MEENIKELPTPDFLFKDGANVIKNYGFEKGGWAPPIINVHGPDEGGVWAYHQGEKFPRKMLMFKEARMAKEAMNRLMNVGVRYFPIIIGIFPQRAIRMFSEYSNRLLEMWIGDFDDRRFCTFVREIYRVGMEISDRNCPHGIKKGDNSRCEHERLMMTICWMIEFDDAYRHFLQDLFGYFDKERFMDNPSEECRKILSIAIDKGIGTESKFASLKKVIPIMMRGKIKKYSIEFFKNADISKFILDKYDWYHVLKWNGWKFGGIEYAKRRLIRDSFDSNLIEWEEAWKWIKNNSYKD